MVIVNSALAALMAASFFIFAIGLIAILAVSFAKPKPANEKYLEKAILQTVHRLRGMKYEVMVVLDANGEVFLEQTQYDTESVLQTEEQTAAFKAHRRLVQIHNHVDDTPPSVQDLYIASKSDFAQIIVATPQWVYRILRPEGGWKSEAELNDAINKHIGLFDVSSCGSPRIVIRPDGGLDRAQDYEVLSTDNSLAAVCQDLGYKLEKGEVKTSQCPGA